MYVMVPAGTWRKNDVVLMSMRRDDVASTLIRRHFGIKCPLEKVSKKIKLKFKFHVFLLDLSSALVFNVRRIIY